MNEEAEKCIINLLEMTQKMSDEIQRLRQELSKREGGMHCPLCGKVLEDKSEDELYCENDGIYFQYVEKGDSWTISYMD